MSTIVLRNTKGSALTFTEVDNNFSNLNNDKIQDIVEDTTPQLGGNLDVNGNSIVSVSNGNITLAPNGTGKVVISGDLQVDGTTTTINSTTLDVDDKNITLAKGAANAGAADGGGITLEGPATAATILYESTDDSWNFNKKTAAPELQVDNINVNGNTIASTDTNGDLVLTPNGTGDLVLDGLNWPQADGTSNQVLKTNGAGQLSWTTISSGLNNIVEDTTPQLGGDLDVNSYKITNSSVGTPNISIEAGTGGDVVIGAGALIPTEGILLNTADLTIAAGSTYNVKIQGITYPKTDGTNNQFLKTNGSGVLSFATIVQATGNELENVVEDTTPQLGGDLDVNGYNIVSVSNGDIDIVANGTGKILLDADFVGVAGTLSTSSAANLVLNTNYGTSTGAITITAGANGNIEIAPNGTGDVYLTADTVRVGDSNANATITTNGTGDLILNTNSGTNSGSITIADGANGDISIDANGTGTVNFNDDVVRALTLKDYAETVYDLGTTSGTITPDVANGNVQKITLSGNLTFSAFSNPVSGQSMTLIINTNGSSRTLTSTMKFAGGSKTISTTSTIDIISVFYDGTNYLASLAKDFK